MEWHVPSAHSIEKYPWSPGQEHGWKPPLQRGKGESWTITQSATGMLKHVEFTLGLLLRTLSSASFSTSTTGEVSLGSQIPDRYTSGKCLFSSYRHAAQAAGNFQPTCSNYAWCWPTSQCFSLYSAVSLIYHFLVMQFHLWILIVGHFLFFFFFLVNL